MVPARPNEGFVCLQFLRLGHRGYKKIMSNLMTVTKRLEEGILETGVNLTCTEGTFAHPCKTPC